MALVKTPVLKVILCGEYGVGKSSLFRRFINNTFVPNSDRRSTLGLDHFDKLYQLTDKDIKVYFIRTSCTKFMEKLIA